MFNQLVMEMNPFKGLSYLNDYFDKIQLSQRFQSNKKLNSNKFNLNNFYQKHFLFISNLLFVLDLTYMLALYFVPLTHFQRLVLLDYFYILQIPRQFNIILFFIFIQIFYYYYLLYGGQISRNDLARLPYQTLIRDNFRMFPSNFIVDPNGGIKLVSKKIKLVSLNYFRMLQIFILTCGKTFANKMLSKLVFSAYKYY